ncbi:MAG TPA: DUF2282 domain-containing protein [Gammaproteobacteria bacterium]|nr:DUF2282 domain-containing protein [Gammaproteobacteria bacterium]
MNSKPPVALSAISGLLALGTVATVPAVQGAPAFEQCFGIAKAHMNDCAAGKHSCAGTATRDRQSDAFVLLPKGVCSKIAGGGSTPREAENAQGNTADPG